MENYRILATNGLTQQNPAATIATVLGQSGISKQLFPYILGTLPYRTAVVGGRFAEMPDTLRNKLVITIGSGPDALTITKSLPELRISGTVVATGSLITLGSLQELKVTLTDPSGNNQQMSREHKAGEYITLLAGTNAPSVDQLSSLETKLNNTRAKLQSNETTINRDDVLGDTLYAALAAFQAVNQQKRMILTKSFGIRIAAFPSVHLAVARLNTTLSFGLPISAAALKPQRHEPGIHSRCPGDLYDPAHCKRREKLQRSGLGRDKRKLRDPIGAESFRQNPDRSGKHDHRLPSHYRSGYRSCKRDGLPRQGREPGPRPEHPDRQRQPGQDHPVQRHGN